jgi:hypothetical protein
LSAAGIDLNQVAINASSTEYYSAQFEGGDKVRQVSGYDLGPPGQTLRQYLGGSVAAALLSYGGVSITNQVVVGVTCPR